MTDVTSANAVLILAVPSVLPVPQQIQGFSTDDIFTPAAIVPVHTLMGADGRLSGGFVPTEKKTVITLQADSASGGFFDAWFSQQEANVAAYPCFGSLTFPSLGVSFALTTGFLSSYLPMSAAKQIMQPRSFEITWEKILGTPVGLAG